MLFYEEQHAVGFNEVVSLLIEFMQHKEKKALMCATQRPTYWPILVKDIACTLFLQFTRFCSCALTMCFDLLL